MSFLKNLFSDKRADSLRNLAFDLDMSFSNRDEFQLRKRLGGFQLFQKGHSRTIYNLMIKEDDWLETQYAIFDYKYTQQQGKTAKIYRQTVFFMDSKKLELPEFLMKPEHFLHKIGKYFNLVKDIEFTNHPEFSNKYLIQSEYPDMLKEQTKEGLINMLSIENKWTLEGINYHLIFYEAGRLISIDQIKNFHNKGLAIFEHFKNAH